MEIIRKRIANLLSVKSLVTIVLTIVFAYMAVTGKISQDFMTIYAVIIAFYFGTQSQKTQDILDNNESIVVHDRKQLIEWKDHCGIPLYEMKKRTLAQDNMILGALKCAKANGYSGEE